MSTNEEAVNVMMWGEAFRFLAGCFYQPKKELLEGAEFLPALIGDLEEICPAAVSYVKSMQESLTEYTEEELAVEYARLFVGPFGLKAPPYGSIYLDSGRTVMGPSTMEAISFYEREGLSRDKDFHELPDHIAVELEFMYFLTYRQVEALQKGDDELAKEFQAKANEFKSRFMNNWIPCFYKNIKAETDNKFYSALADCLDLVMNTGAAERLHPSSKA
jgi:putative dimethyl sulfoxide reductase chaperone